MGSFEIANDTFLLNGERFMLISGAMHYFRVPRPYWRDRLEKLALMGCNTVETYLPWNLHEPHSGAFDFRDDLDVEAYVRLAQEIGLWVILRPSPYICGEFEFGGLPWWLLRDRAMRVRSSYAGFTAAVERYYDQLLPRLAALQITHGGPVIAMQIENEYGYYGNDSSYLVFLRDAMQRRGIDVPLFTSDGPWGHHLTWGSVDGVLATANFGSGAPQHFKKLQELQPGKPLVCMEFWLGWFDAWRQNHHTRTPQDSAAALDEILAQGHANIYMFHGGTNFGFTSGANHAEHYTPDVTSYDYDAPLSEDGQCTPKFDALRQVIARYRDVPERQSSFAVTRAEPRELAVAGRAAVLSQLHQMVAPVASPLAQTMEDLNQGYGYVVYRLQIRGSDQDTALVLHRCADRALVYLDGAFVALRESGAMTDPIPLAIDASEHALDILVENQGRVNFGHRMDDQRKGIDGGVLINGCAAGPITHFSLPFDAPLSVTWTDESIAGAPSLHRFELDYQAQTGYHIDHFLNMDGWGKGIVIANGRNLGRFWDAGPQRTLYLPGCFLQRGVNEIVVFETEGRYCDRLSVTGSPDLG